MEFEEKQLTSKPAYEGIIINIIEDEVELTNGKKTKREIALHPGGVVIVAQKDKNTVLMVKQYRYPVKQTLLELPAGKLQYGEDPFLAAKRELEEETGYLANTWKDLGFIYTTPGFCSEKLYLYLATDLIFKKQCPDEDEIIQSFEYNLTEVFELINSGKINDSKTICALTRAFKI